MTDEAPSDPVARETRLQASQAYNRSIIEALPTALLVVDSAMTVYDVNEGMVKLTGIPRRDLRGSKLDEIAQLSPKSRLIIQGAFADVSGSNINLHIGFGRSGVRSRSCVASGFSNPDGAPLLLIATAD